MFRALLNSILLFALLVTSSVAAQTATPNGNVLGFGPGVPAATPPPAGGPTLGFGPGVPTGGDPTAFTGNVEDYVIGEPVPGNGGAPAGGAPAGGGSVKGEATMDEIREALNTYTIPTSTRNFSLSNLNVGNEASLIISSGNEENNVIFRVIRLIAMLVGTVAILLYIVAGYFMIFSQGEDNSLTKGKQIIAFTTLGLGLSFGAYAIVQLVMGLIYFTS